MQCTACRRSSAPSASAGHCLVAVVAWFAVTEPALCHCTVGYDPGHARRAANRSTLISVTATVAGGSCVVRQCQGAAEIGAPGNPRSFRDMIVLAECIKDLCYSLAGHCHEFSFAASFIGQPHNGKIS